MSADHDSDLDLSSNVAPAKRWLSWREAVVLLGVGAVLVLLLLPAVRSAPNGGARRTRCSNNLKQIALALHNYNHAYGAFPPAYTVDAQGNPLHSWRTLILPFLDEKPLYDSIDLSKPWNDPVNAAAFQTAVQVYHCPSAADVPEHHTTYLAVTGPNACFRPGEGRKLSEITDGLEQTLIVIEAPLNRAVPWMSPQDAEAGLVLSIGADSKLAHQGGHYGAFADGRVTYLSQQVSPTIRRALISIAGGETVGEF